jgi:hypothetical protein
MAEKRTADDVVEALPDSPVAKKMRTDEAPRRYLFIGHSRDAAPLEAWIYTRPDAWPTHEGLGEIDVLHSILDQMASNDYASAEDAIHCPDILRYISGEWNAHRPPDALPISLFFVDRAQLGKVERVPDTLATVVCPFANVFSFGNFGRVSGGDESRAVSDKIWTAAVAWNETRAERAPLFAKMKRLRW